jgi:Uncharacterized protein conserved in bacteria (DUF2252)
MPAVKTPPLAREIRKRAAQPRWPETGSVSSPADRAAFGKTVRSLVPREEHAAFDLPADRPDPVGLLEEQARTRLPDLVPVRYGRMAVSPFTYFRDAALPMASDLSATPVTGLPVQACGDAHLSNFGVFGSPERRMMFDINDFDETLPGPWEWDVKRLAASVEIAAREKGLPARQRRNVVLAAAGAYREALRAFAAMTNLQVWYSHLDLSDLQGQVKPGGRLRKAIDTGVAKARGRDSMQAMAKLTQLVDGQPKIVSDPPLTVPVRDLVEGQEEAAGLYGMLLELFTAYRQTLPADTAQLAARYELADIARKVVGVGSVGTRCWIVLMLAADGSDPLFLQVKEAQPSVLAEFAGPSRFANQGERVVVGQRFMQTASDIFLGWVRVPRGIDGKQHDFYVRQLRDWKLSADIGGMPASWLRRYAGYCGWTLARAHAKTGDRYALAAYLGASDVFDNAIADFAASYADQNERDHARLVEAIKSGEVPCEAGV